MWGVPQGSQKVDLKANMQKSETADMLGHAWEEGCIECREGEKKRKGKGSSNGRDRINTVYICISPLPGKRKKHHNPARVGLGELEKG